MKLAWRFVSSRLCVATGNLGDYRIACDEKGVWSVTVDDVAVSGSLKACQAVCQDNEVWSE